MIEDIIIMTKNMMGNMCDCINRCKKLWTMQNYIYLSNNAYAYIFTSILCEMEAPFNGVLKVRFWTRNV